MTSSDLDEILAECSDEEEFNRVGISYKNIWSPKLEEIEGLFQQVKNKNLELFWKCPGRRDPNQPEEPKSEPDTSESSASVKDAEADGFDFEMDDDAPPTASLKSTPKSGNMFKTKTTFKKTTTLAGILSNMERHRIIEQLDSSPVPGDAKQDPKTES